MDPKQEKVYIGIRAEDKSYWERRTPLPPENCKRIMEQVKVYFQDLKSTPTFNSLCNPLTREFSLTNSTEMQVVLWKRI